MRSKLIRAGRASLSKLMLPMASPIASALSRFVPGNQAYPAFARHGYHLLRKHYYLPIPDDEDLEQPCLHRPAPLVGIDLNEAGALELSRTVIASYDEEFRRAFPLHPTADPKQF